MSVQKIFKFRKGSCHSCGHCKDMAICEFQINNHHSLGFLK